MKLVKSISHPSVVEALQGDGIVVLRTDTLYGLLARADSQSAVERVYDIKDRNASKSSIVLIASAAQMFDELPASASQLAVEPWPERTSVILPATKAPLWIRRANASVAYRVPNVKDLQQLLSSTGPLIAPSANPEGQPPAQNIDQAIDYFGDSVDVYVDGGQVGDEAPSRLLRLTGSGQMERLR